MSRLTPKAATRTRWVRFLVPGVIAVGLLAGGSFYLTRGALSAGPAAGQAAGRAGSTGEHGEHGSRMRNGGRRFLRGEPVRCRHRGVARRGDDCAAQGREPRPRQVGALRVAVAVRGALLGDGSRIGVSSKPATRQRIGFSQPSASAPAGTSQDSAAAAQVLALINQARASAGLPALTILAGLETSSSAHNMTMAGGCGLSHQCPGEPALGDRETAAGVHWTAAGENIGEGGPVADTSAAIAQMAVGLTQSMLDEKPPNDGHRQNILSSTFTHIGIAVYRDSSGTVWLTQDFSN